MITSIGQIGIVAKDFARAVDFYETKLELPLIVNLGNLALFQCGDVRLLLSEPESAAFESASSVLYLNVENIEEAYEKYQEQGIEFTDTPHMVGKLGNTETWMVFFRDTEDNVLALMSEVLVA
ncbi:VOC family protein [Paenisporosarcina cavernae]